MIKTIFRVASMALFLASVSFSSCQSSGEKSDAADAKVKDAKQDLQEAQKDAAVAATKAANAEQWRLYKVDTEMQIKNNERYKKFKPEMKEWLEKNKKNREIMMLSSK